MTATNAAHRTDPPIDKAREVLQNPARFAHPSLTAAKYRDAVEDLETQLNLLDEFEDGLIAWYDIAPDLTCLDKDAEAATIQRQMVEDAVALLVDGK